VRYEKRIYKERRVELYAKQSMQKVKEIGNSIVQLHAIKINVGLQKLLKYSLAANPLW
jgi:hypothetical protein